MASKRLSTIFGEEKGFLGKPEGSFQDLTRLVIAAAYSNALQKGRATVDKDPDLILSHQYNEGELGQTISGETRSDCPQAFLNLNFQ